MDLRYSFKKIIRKIHLWLGMLTGPVVFIVSITGAIYAFQEEINLLLQAGVYKNVTPEAKPFLTPEEIRQKSLDFFQREDIIYMTATVYPKGDRATIVWLRDSNRKYTAIMLNPYSGEVIHSFPYNINFWAIILGLHTHLLIPVVGSHLVSISTLLFVIILISGLVLWYPKQKKHLRQRLTIKWGASPKRLNYDLHNVLGFYMSWIVIFVILTGLILSYDWMRNSVYWVATAGQSPVKEIPVTSAIPDDPALPGGQAEKSILSIIASYSNLDNYFLKYAVDSAGYYELTLNSKEGYFYNKHDHFAIDQYTGEKLKKDLWEDKNSGDKLLEANLNIHIGQILGFPGKVLAFFASLIAASLPVTGFLIWKGRRKQSKKVLKKSRVMQ